MAKGSLGLYNGKRVEVLDVDDIVAKGKERLYEADFYAWTQEQARLLRSGKADHADIANIAEEIETLGRKEVSELRSRLSVLALHLLKELYQPEKAGRSWAVTITVQRDEIAQHLDDNPSLEPKAAQVYERAYASARKTATIETGLPAETFPTMSPFSLEQALDETYWPGQPAARRHRD